MYTIYDNMDAFNLSPNSPVVGFVGPSGQSKVHPVSFSNESSRPDLFYDSFTGNTFPAIYTAYFLIYI